ncbi:hypothetical protein B0H13DRAFT_1927756 [Mycena leptocephala]|nr:hypothetical protein B0H13DRAFT_1927756 [Mycena leptocephala]
MHSILKSAPDITDFFFTLNIWGSDSFRGLCTGFHRSILSAKKNKQVTQLFETLLGIIPKWDKLHEINPNTTLDTWAEALALALGKSQSLQTLVVCAGFIFPEYLRQLVNVPSIKSLRFVSLSLIPQAWLNGIHNVVNQDPKLGELITFSSQDDPPKREIPTPLPSSSQSSYVFIQDLQELKRVRETGGGSVADLDISIGGPVGPGSKKVPAHVDPEP